MARREINDREEAIITDALQRYVTVLCDEAYDVEGGAAHDDVIALAYVMPAEVVADWGAWVHMTIDWIRAGRAPIGVQTKEWGQECEGPFVDRFWSDARYAATMVARVIADGLDDERLVLLSNSPYPEDEADECDGLLALLALSGLCDLEQGERIVDHVETAVDESEQWDQFVWDEGGDDE